MLYFGLGDGGSAGDQLGHGQNTNSLLGSMLRLDVDGGVPYAIPMDNPLLLAAAGARSSPGAFATPGVGVSIGAAVTCGWGMWDKILSKRSI